MNLTLPCLLHNPVGSQILSLGQLQYNYLGEVSKILDSQFLLPKIQAKLEWEEKCLCSVYLSYTSNIIGDSVCNTCKKANFSTIQKIQKSLTIRKKMGQEDEQMAHTCAHTQMANKYMKRCSSLFIIKEIQV